MRVAVAQFGATMSKAANLEKITRLAAQAADAGARLVVFPEAAMCDFGEKTDDLHSVAEPLDGRFVTTLCGLAARHTMTVVAGMFESIPGERLIYNTAGVIDPGDGLVCAFQQRHLFDGFWEVESGRLRACGYDAP